VSRGVTRLCALAHVATDSAGARELCARRTRVAVTDDESACTRRRCHTYTVSICVRICRVSDVVVLTLFIAGVEWSPNSCTRAYELAQDLLLHARKRHAGVPLGRTAPLAAPATALQTKAGLLGNAPPSRVASTGRTPASPVIPAGARWRVMVLVCLLSSGL
jgi:hypothetical protein